MALPLLLINRTGRGEDGRKKRTIMSMSLSLYFHYLFLTMGPVELLPSKPYEFGFQAADVFSFYFVCILVIGGLVLHMKRDPLLIDF